MTGHIFLLLNVKRNAHERLCPTYPVQPFRRTAHFGLKILPVFWFHDIFHQCLHHTTFEYTAQRTVLERAFALYVRRDASGNIEHG
ncbi:hypothetical protein P3T25_008163 [Paraburkholderia sp. GAS32]